MEVIPVVLVGPVAGCRVIVPGWVPTAACAAVEPSSDAPATSAPAPSSTAVRLSRFRRKIGIPFMEGFLSGLSGQPRALNSGSLLVVTPANDTTLQTSRMQ